MISSATNPQQYHHVQGTSSATAAQSVNTAHSVNTAASTGNDHLEQSKDGFKNAWLRSLEQEKRVQNTGVANEHTRVEKMNETMHAQKVSDMLSQERQKKV